MRGCVLAVLVSLAVVVPARAGAGDDDKARLLERARALNSEGVKLLGQGQPRQAQEKLQEALALARKALPAGHPDIAQSLNNLAMAYLALGQADKARTLNEEALAMRQKALLAGHPDIAQSLSNLAEAYRALGQPDKARDLHEEALVLRRKALPAGHPDIAQSLNNLAVTYSKLGQADKARLLHEEALALFRKALPAGHLNIAQSLHNLAGAYSDLGQEGKARALNEEALAIRRKALPAGHPLITQSLNNLATAYHALGQPDKARVLHEEALTLRRKALPAGHPLIAISLSNLAEAYRALGQADKARTLLEEALTIQKTALPAGHPSIIVSLNNLALTYLALGQPDKARGVFEENLALRRKALPVGHPLIARSLSSLAKAYSDLGQADKARTLLEEALAIRRKALPAGHSDIALSLSGLAGVYIDLGQPAKAQPLYEEALAIQLKALPAGHPNLADSLNNLSVTYRALGQPDKARLLLEEALALMKKALPAGHPRIAQSLNNLGSAYWRLGQADKARVLHEEALALWRKALPAGHPDIARSLSDLAVTYLALGRPDKAWQCAAEACTVVAGYRLRLLAGTPQRLHAPFLASERSLQFLLGQAEKTPDLSPAHRQELLRLLVGHQALGLTLTLRHEAALAGGDDESAALYARLKEVRQRLADRLLQGPPAKNPDAYRALCEDLQRQQDDLEQQLADRVAGYQPLRRATEVDPGRLADALGDGAALVQLTTYRGWDTKARRWGERRYAALLLWRGEGGEAEVRFVPLGGADLIGKAVRTWRADVQKGGTADKPAAELRRRLWEPLAKALPAGVKRLVICPEGQLALLPLGALRLEGGRYLVEDFAVRYVGSSRDLLPAPALKPATGPALLVSDPDYGAPPGFRRLPGFAREATTAAKLLAAQPGWQVRALSGAGATEEALAAAQRPRLLYLITHGFFLEDVRPSAGQGLRDLELFDKPAARPAPGPDPRLKSGLALAGANRGAERSAKGLSDGLLTALEVENLDLLGTELVILSACETGLGEMQVGEGVLGLRRAFQLAGAQTVIASLWRVPDAETEKLMTGFLGRWLKGAGKAEALRQAQLEMIRELRKSSAPALRGAPPLYWAGFVCHGRAE